jgi:sigma-B regulation protein RsbU (phosphoserine phosphatase)
VVGKGLPAALYAALVVGAFRGLHKSELGPAEALALLNRRLRVRPIPGRFCAAHYATVDLKTGRVIGANAGLPHPLHLSAAGAQPVGGGGLPIALFDESEYELYSISPRPGESLLFYTDGIVDARSPEGEEFGVSRLAEYCARNWRAHPEGLLQGVVEELERFSEQPFDDVTLALVRMREFRP